ncbi:MAG TPA: glycine-rich domain-containing protein-like [Allosphingosinicella sp.]
MATVLTREQMRPFAPSSKTEHIEFAMEAIASIDLTMVKKKLMDPEEGQGWSQEHTEWVEQRYRRYLCMLYLSRRGSVVPTRDIDLFWHQHILDTRGYADDCDRVFGEFIHHFPYFGMRGDDDARALESSFDRTKAIYASLFGEDYAVARTATSNQVGKCHDEDTSTCHKCSSDSPTCHKCTSSPDGEDTIQCTKCKSDD